jgi:hypothetical protein
MAGSLGIVSRTSDGERELAIALIRDPVLQEED